MAITGQDRLDIELELLRGGGLCSVSSLFCVPFQEVLKIAKSLARYHGLKFMRSRGEVYLVLTIDRLYGV